MSKVVCDWIEKNCRFPKKAKHKLAGQPAKLLKWQRKIIADLFDKEGKLKKRYLFIQSKRKIGKTVFFSWVLCWLYLGDDKECGLEIPIVANRWKTTLTIWQLIAEAIELACKNHLLYEFKKYEIRNKDNGNLIFCASSASQNAFGKQPYPVCVFEEMQNWPQIDGHELMSAYSSGMQGAQGLIAMLCNPGKDYTNQFYVDLVKRMRAHKGHKDYSVWIFEADRELPIDSIKAIKQADPCIAENYFKVSDLKAIKQEAELAKESIQAEDSFRRNFLGQTLLKSAMSFVDVRKFKILKNPDLDLPMSIGADLSIGDDRTSICYTRQLPNDRGFLFSWRAYLPEGSLEKMRKSKAEKQRLYEKQNFLTIQRGDVIDQDQIYDDISKEIKNCKKPLGFFYDYNCGANYLGNRLSGIVKVNKMLSTGRHMTPLIQNFERAVLAGLAYFAEKENKLAAADINLTCLKYSKNSRNYKLVDSLSPKDSVDSSMAALYSMQAFLVKKERDWSLYNDI